MGHRAPPEVSQLHTKVHHQVNVKPGDDTSNQGLWYEEGSGETAKFTFTGVPKPDSVPDAPAAELASEPVITKTGAVGGPPSGPSTDGGGGTASAVG